MAVYPRWRGEHSTATPVANGARGLSPLARGTRQAAPSGGRGSRFIPAGAGNTIKKLFCVSFRSVYPRWRGEHFYSVNNRSLIVGLSPLARGTHVANRLIIIYFRFIPAGAGNTDWWTDFYFAPAVYPRWRGEHELSCGYRCVYVGLSPLARGTL